MRTSSWCQPESPIRSVRNPGSQAIALNRCSSRARREHSPREGRAAPRGALGNWLTAEQGRRLLQTESPPTLRGLRDHAMVALLLDCGLRRGEALTLALESVQQREEHWVIADLMGKAGHVRTVPIPHGVKASLDAWTTAAGLTRGRAFRAINKAGRVWGDGLTAKVIWDVVKAATHAGIEKLAPHALRRTCARLCHLAGGEFDQIQFLLGHVSIQTTERYLGCKQKLRCAVNDTMGLEPEPSA